MKKSQPALTSHTISALILAAGKGTRMKSTRPKVLHSVLGRPMLSWVMDAVKKAGATDVTIILSPDHKAFAELIDVYPDLRVVIQDNQRGTGDAVASAAKAYSGAATPSWAEGRLLKGSAFSAEWVLICAGDTPAINPSTIREFIAATIASKKKIAVLGMNASDPKGYGRMVKARDGGLGRIIEDRDADAETKKIGLCNSGIVFADVNWLFELLVDLAPNNAQSEYYLTDIFAASADRGHSAFIFEAGSEREFAGVNDREQLAAVEKTLLLGRIRELAAHGVTFHSPETCYIEADVSIEPDVSMFPGACIRGKSKIARNCVIGPGAYLQDTVLDAGVNVGAHAVLIGCRISAGETISPQACFSGLQL